MRKPRAMCCRSLMLLFYLYLPEQHSNLILYGVAEMRLCVNNSKLQRVMVPVV